MEEKLTFTRLPRSVYWICCSNFQKSKKSYAAIVDHLQSDPFLNLSLKRLFPSSQGKSGLEAQLAGYGIKGFRNKLAELFLYRLMEGRYPDEVEANLVLDVLEFENRFEDFGTMGDSRAFMLGLYLKMKDIESLVSHRRQTDYLSLSVEVDEILAQGASKIGKLDWTILTLASLLKIWNKENILKLASAGADILVERVLKMDDKSKMIFLNDLMSYGHALDEKEFFLYQKV